MKYILYLILFLFNSSYNIVLSQIYDGGNGDGYSVDCYNQSENQYLNIYSGGNSDGFSIDCYAQSDNIAFDIYSGGDADGFTVDCYQQADNIAFDIYAGGNADGFTVDCYSQSDNISFDIYSGGNADGFTIDCYEQSDNVLYMIYSGGNGDGFTFDCLGTVNEVPLPISLLSYNVKLIDGIVYIDWITTSEINNDYFTIEKSNDTFSWKILGKIKGAGNSSQQNFYRIEDNNPFKNITYYKLLQTDYNGLVSLIGIEAIYLVGDDDIEIYPNPTSGLITIKGGDIDFNNISIYNLLGQNLKASIKLIETNNNKIKLDLSSLNSGLYTIRINSYSYKIYKQ